MGKAGHAVSRPTTTGKLTQKRREEEEEEEEERERERERGAGRLTNRQAYRLCCYFFDEKQ